METTRQQYCNATIAALQEEIQELKHRAYILMAESRNEEKADGLYRRAAHLQEVIAKLQED